MPVGDALANRANFNLTVFAQIVGHDVFFGAIRAVIIRDYQQMLAILRQAHFDQPTAFSKIERLRVGCRVGFFQSLLLLFLGLGIVVIFFGYPMQQLFLLSGQVAFRARNPFRLIFHFYCGQQAHQTSGRRDSVNGITTDKSNPAIIEKLRFAVTFIAAGQLTNLVILG